MTLGVLLIGTFAHAGTIDPREGHVMLEALLDAGAQTTTGAEGQSQVIADNMDCLRIIPPDATESVACTFTDDSNGNPLTIDDGDPVFILTSHYGGSLNEWEKNKIDYQETTASQVVCSKYPGENQPWLCDVDSKLSALAF